MPLKVFHLSQWLANCGLQATPSLLCEWSFIGIHDPHSFACFVQLFAHSGTGLKEIICSAKWDIYSGLLPTNFATRAYVSIQTNFSSPSPSTPFRCSWPMSVGKCLTFHGIMYSSISRFQEKPRYLFILVLFFNWTWAINAFNAF